jgi:hypothetical protein
MSLQVLGVVRASDTGKDAELTVTAMSAAAPALAPASLKIKVEAGARPPRL